MTREEQSVSVNNRTNDAAGESAKPASGRPQQPLKSSQPPGIEPGIDYIWGSDQDELAEEMGEQPENNE